MSETRDDHPLLTKRAGGAFALLVFPALGIALMAANPNALIWGVGISAIGVVGIWWLYHKEIKRIRLCVKTSNGNRESLSVDLWIGFLLLVVAVIAPSVVLYYAIPVPPKEIHYGASQPAHTESGPSPQIYNKFISAHERYQVLIGDPVSPASSVPEAIEEWSDSSHLVWLSNVPIICAFPLQEGQGYICEKDPRVAEPKYWDSHYIQKSLHLQKNDYIPKGGIAYFLINEPNKWGWVGKVNAACTINNVHYQRFAGGDIFGPFPATDGNSPLQFFIITLPDGEWRSVSGSDENQEQCKPY